MRSDINVNRSSLVENCVASCQRMTALLQKEPRTLSDLNKKRCGVCFSIRQHQSTKQTRDIQRTIHSNIQLLIEVFFHEIRKIINHYRLGQNNFQNNFRYQIKVDSRIPNYMVQMYLCQKYRRTFATGGLPNITSGYKRQFTAHRFQN